ncbi:MAG: carboxypeptidase-like regulatory domain-containing protein [Algoriphagus sp.]|nr:carboxypeptidase-like regulatory domain-containing protein [Algoriphagus sp.]
MKSFFERNFQTVLFILLAFFSMESFGQTISGVVTDAKSGEPMPFTNVFLNNTTIGNTTNEKGEFKITGDLPKTLELVASFVGYITSSQQVSFSGKNQLTVNFKLEPLESMLSEVQLESRIDKKWERNLKRFKDVFLALPDDTFAKQLEITNPWVLEFEDVKGEKGPNHVRAFAQQALQIENDALGYHIEYNLQDYRLYKTGARYYGFVHYTPKASTDSVQSITWDDNKETSYQGSTRHLLKSLLLSLVPEQGFSLYTVNPAPMDRIRTNSFSVELGQSIEPLSEDSIRRIPLSNGNFRVIWPGRVEVHYANKSWLNEYYIDVYNPISWITAPQGFFDIDRNGIPVNPTQLVLSGYMGRQRAGRFLPNDYVSTGLIQYYNAEVDSNQRVFAKWNNLREKPYLTTNKAYYYPGETVWLGGKMLYQNRLLADSLSRVLYVDVMNSETKVIQSEIFPILEGKVQGGFVLPDSLDSGDYFIRVYTQWMRNYPDRDFFLRPLPVLKKGEWVQATELDEANFFGDLEIKLDHSSVKTGSVTETEISLTFLDETGELTNAEFTISVTDDELATPINMIPTLTEAMNWLDEKANPPSYQASDFQIEYGISVEGKFERDKRNQPFLNPITVVRGDLEDYGIVQTDSSGYFRATGLSFTDSATIALAALDKNQKPYGSVSLITREKPVFRGSFPKYSYQAFSKNAKEFTYDLLGDYILLDEFVKEDEAIETMAKKNYGYGPPDREMKADKLATISPEAFAGYFGFKRGGKSIGNFNFGLNASNPLLIIDGASYPFLNDDEFELLISSFVPAELESVAVYTYNATTFGLAGFGGVIMIETKKGIRVAAGDKSNFNSEGFQLFRMRGFSPELTFKNSFDSEEIPVNKPTIYWNPAGNTLGNQGVFTFKVKTPPEVKTMNIWVEGTTEEGFPFAKMFKVSQF